MGLLLEPLTPALVLAPMEGVTDEPMRELMTEIAPFSFCVSEFLRVSQEVPPKKVFREFVPELNRGSRTAAGTPVQIQLLGGSAERLARSAALACELGSPGVDLNFGCPAPTVNRHDGGATLLKYPDRIREIVTAVRAAVPKELPVSAKLRLGWDDPRDIHRNADMAAEGGANWITIHGRTRAAGYAPPIDWEPIGSVRRRLGGPAGIPVVANGDIQSFEDFLRCREITGCIHYMIGRGALGNPKLPREIARELETREASRFSRDSDAVLDWPSLFERFAGIHRARGYPESVIVRRIKQWGSLGKRAGGFPQFDAIKTRETFLEIVHELRGSELPLDLKPGRAELPLVVANPVPNV